MKTYTPGLHIIRDMSEANQIKLSSLKQFESQLLTWVNELNLQPIGMSSYAFDNGGFTLTLGLTESHLSVHTWPEYNKVNFDVFLSNFMKVNDGVCLTLANRIQDWFEGNIVQEHQIRR